MQHFLSLVVLRFQIEWTLNCILDISSQKYFLPKSKIIKYICSQKSLENYVYNNNVSRSVFTICKWLLETGMRVNILGKVLTDEVQIFYIVKRI